MKNTNKGNQSKGSYLSVKKAYPNEVEELFAEALVTDISVCIGLADALATVLDVCEALPEGQRTVLDLCEA